MQYDRAVQKWHTCKGTEPIHSTNPCSEYVFLNNTACNLASLNLMKFKREDGRFDIERFKAAVRIYITAQEILVDNASYPTEKIAINSHNYRPLGLGYANLGALLMACGLPYDSDAGRAFAGTVTALMHGEAYLASACLAAAVGPFPHFERNREPMLEVLEYLTREFPHSAWFDDRATPTRETRDDILRRSFDAAVLSLGKQLGNDVNKWRWANLNTLRIAALSGQPEMARSGGPIVGTSFTVNPGGGIGPVGGGASWRVTPTVP